MDKDSYVWISNHPEFEWWPGRVVSRSEDSVVAEDFDGNKFKIPVQLATFTKDPFTDGVEDLLKLDELNDGVILHTVRTKYLANAIYTSIGSSIMIALNPYKPLPIYDEAIKSDYARATTPELLSKPCHLYKITELVYRTLRESQTPHSVILTGESGSGKTESAKIILNYLTTHSGHKGLEEKILFSNPLLEAFGNAQTVRNDNSSRFGKYIELVMRKNVKGARIENYLLEKSRIVTQSYNERNYHIFYQLYHSGDEKRLSGYQLTLADKWAYMNLSFLNRDEQIQTDALRYQETLESLKGLGFEPRIIEDLLRTVAGLLHLGNAKIEGNEESSAVAPNCGHLKAASELIGVSAQSLASLMCLRSIVDPSTKKKITISLPLASARVNRDTIAKVIYHELFSWLTGRINSAISGHQHSVRDSKKAGPAKEAVGLLDIFGFEIFEDNSFEQLCINYANEKLQAHFNDHVFRLEQEFYRLQGVSWDKIAYENNEQTLSLIEGRPYSLITLLDQECLYVNSKDAVYLDKIRSQFAAHPSFIQRQLKSKKDCFGVRHYAGDVYYTVDGFLEKNRNSTNRDLVETLSSSENRVLKEIFEKIAEEDTKPSKKNETVVKQFSAQLDQLLKRLDASDLVYLRCVKPNSLKLADYFESKIVQSQLRAAGILQVLKIRKQGFPYRQGYEDFGKAYQGLFRMCKVRSNDCRGLLKLVYDKLLKPLFKAADATSSRAPWKKGKHAEERLGKGLTMGHEDLERLSKLVPKQLIGKPFDELVQFGASKVLAKEIVKLLLDYFKEKSWHHYARVVQAAFRKRRQLTAVKLIVAAYRSCGANALARRGLRSLCAKIALGQKGASKLAVAVGRINRRHAEDAFESITELAARKADLEKKERALRLEAESNKPMLEGDQQLGLSQPPVDKRPSSMSNESPSLSEFPKLGTQQAPLADQNSGPLWPNGLNYQKGLGGPPEDVVFEPHQHSLSETISEEESRYISSVLKDSLRRPNPAPLKLPATKVPNSKAPTKPPVIAKRTPTQPTTSNERDARRPFNKPTASKLLAVQLESAEKAYDDSPKLDLNDIDMTANSIWEINNNQFKSHTKAEKAFYDKSLLDPVARELQEARERNQELEEQLSGAKTELALLKESSARAINESVEKHKGLLFKLYEKEKAIEDLNNCVQSHQETALDLTRHISILEGEIEAFKRSASRESFGANSDELKSLRQEAKSKSEQLAALQKRVSDQNILVAKLRIKKNQYKQDLKIKDQLLESRHQANGTVRDQGASQAKKLQEEKFFLQHQNEIYKELFSDLMTLLKYKKVENMLLAKLRAERDAAKVLSLESEIRELTSSQSFIQEHLDSKTKELRDHKGPL